jgi:tetratricopeptide (TPR) repeat protein
MGLFGGGGFEKTEAKADAVLAKGDALQAFRLYGEALRQAGSKAADAAERLRGKQTRARRDFVSRKIEEARGFVSDEIAEHALEALAIARDYVEEREADLSGEIAELTGRAVALGGEPPSGKIERIEEEAVAEPEAPEEETVPETSAIEAEFLDLEDAETDPELLFEQLAGVLSEKDAERADALGRAFKTGFVAAQRGDAEGARTALEEALRAHPDDPLVLESLALAYDHAGRPVDAAACYRRTLEADPTRWNARIALASVVSGTSAAGGQPDAAIGLLDEGLQVDSPRAVTYQLAAAEILLTQKRPADAIPRIERAMEAGAREAAGAWQLYGTALEDAGMLEEAEDALVRSVRLAGSSMQPRAQFAEFALRTGRALEEAGEMIFETCINCQATMPSADELDYYGFLLTRLQFARGQHRQALEGADRLLAKGPVPAVREVLLEVRKQAKEAMARKAAPDAPSEEEA